MGLFDQMKDMAEAAEKAAAEHPDQVKAALGTLEDVVDDTTGGAYHDQIAAARTKAEQFIEDRSRPNT